MNEDIKQKLTAYLENEKAKQQKVIKYVIIASITIGLIIPLLYILFAFIMVFKYNM